MSSSKEFLSSLHPEGLTQTEEILILSLYELNAIRFGEYTWKIHDKHPDAPRFPIYTDFRMLRRDSQAKSIAVHAYQDLIEGLQFDLVSDIPTAVTPLVSSLSDRIGIGQITPRMDSKTHGSGVKVDGLKDEDRGKTAVLIDDLVSFFDSKAQAIEILRGSDILVNDVVVLMDYELGGRAESQRYGVKLHNAFTASQMLQFSQRVGRISPDTYLEVEERFSQAQEYFKNLLS